MALSDPQIGRLLKTRFVCTWYNQAPESFPRRTPADYEPLEGEEAGLPDGAGDGNVKIFFCAPDGRILCYWRGMASRDALLDQARRALDLLPIWEQLRHRPAQARRALARAHAGRAYLLRREIRPLERVYEGHEGDPAMQETANRLNSLWMAHIAHQIAAENAMRDPKPLMVVEWEG